MTADDAGSEIENVVFVIQTEKGREKEAETC
jgi:hypothetical protein